MDDGPNLIRDGILGALFGAILFILIGLTSGLLPACPRQDEASAARLAR